MKPPAAADRNKGLPPDVAAADAYDPDIRLHIMPADRRRSAAKLRFLISSLSGLGLVLLTAGLGGCASGDFGRPRDSVFNDDMHRWVGQEATGSIGRRSSDFQLTDYERTLRDRAYFYIEPPHARPAWKSVFGDYEPIPAPWRQKAPRFDRTAYGRLLIDEPHRSHASRYAQLIEDVRNDITQLDPFFSTAARVADLDQKRSASLQYISDLEPRERADALARMKENALIVQWVGLCLQQRIASYRWALERLVVHAPDGMAAEVDRLIADLAARTAASLGATPVVGQVLTVKG